MERIVCFENECVRNIIIHISNVLPWFCSNWIDLEIIDYAIISLIYEYEYDIYSWKWSKIKTKSYWIQNIQNMKMDRFDNDKQSFFNWRRSIICIPRTNKNIKRINSRLFLWLLLLIIKNIIHVINRNIWAQVPDTNRL